MKRMNIIKFLRVGGIALATGYFSMFSGFAQAGDIVGSVHDFSDGVYEDLTAYAWNTNDELCTVCHTPHAADTTVSVAPLWDRTLTTTTYDLYDTSTTFDGVATIAQPNGISKLCLSCHDGSIALDSFGGVVGTGDTVADMNGGSRNIGEDDGAGNGFLNNDHPVSFEYTEDTVDPGMFASSTLGITIGDGVRSKTGTLAEMMLTNDGGTLTVECTSCHDVHNNYVGTDGTRLLKINLSGSALCLTCHNK